MSISNKCTSPKVGYDSNNRAVIDNWVGCQNVQTYGPPPLSISVQQTKLDDRLTEFTINLFPPGTNVTGVQYKYTIENINFHFPITSNTGNFTSNNYRVTFPRGNTGIMLELCVNLPNSVFTQITLDPYISSNTLSPPQYKISDTYLITALTPSQCLQPPNTIQAQLTRTVIFSSNAKLGGNIAVGNNIKQVSQDQVSNICDTCACLLIPDNLGNVTVPEASLFVITTMDGSDVGEASFIICDEFTYYKEEKTNSKCGVYTIKPEQVKQTNFHRCCPYMVSVLKGKGTTLFEKAQYIYMLMGTEIGIPFDLFYLNIILYGMAKYLSARLLYGNFNINYLLGKYNEKILRDLGTSRFCNFLPFFTDPNSQVYGYNKYFKSGNK